MNEINLFVPFLFLLIFVLPYLNKVKSISEYVQSTSKLGLSESAPLLLAHLVKGFMILIAFQFISRHNLTLGVLLCTILFPITVLYEKWIHSAISTHLNNPNQTPLTYFKAKSSRIAFYGILFIMASIAFFAFFAEITWMTLSISYLFQVSRGVIFISLLFLAYVYAIAGGLSVLVRVSRVMMIFSFFVLICLLLYTYLTNGIYSIYNNWMRMQSPVSTITFPKVSHVSLWFLAILFVYVGYLLTNLSLWHINFSMKENRIKTIYSCTSFCFTSLLMTLMMIVVFVLSSQPDHTSSVNQMLHTLSHHAPFFAYLLIMALLSIGLMSAFVSLKSIIDACVLALHTEQKENPKLFRGIYLTSCGLLLLLFIVLRPTHTFLFTCIKLFSLLCIVSIPTYSLIMLSKQKITVLRLLPLTIGFLTGLCLFTQPSSLLADLFWSFSVSLSLQLFLLLCQKFLHK
ncbi:hypothetical protein ACFP7A_04615 [Sporolactobacillus kofuensis]|uniref:Uncharacterized protein n=1 Tax=Sporolactobacillus kofuensis TaxID=269672 RepID=A0ABW1WE87_9BACL|nr:hypothetical protein [Sporolactobacillus kofuensis]MCO7174874.1 hypothetical protein [Sporolactobacillus kofuensis]